MNSAIVFTDSQSYSNQITFYRPEYNIDVIKPADILSNPLLDDEIDNFDWKHSGFLIDKWD